jgi:hypothetical protein
MILMTASAAELKSMLRRNMQNTQKIKRALVFIVNIPLMVLKVKLPGSHLARPVIYVLVCKKHTRQIKNYFKAINSII